MLISADLDELIGLLAPWGVAMRNVGGYVGGPVDLWPNRDDCPVMATSAGRSATRCPRFSDA